MDWTKPVPPANVKREPAVQFQCKVPDGSGTFELRATLKLFGQPLDAGR